MRNVRIGMLVFGALVLLMVTIFTLGQQQLLWQRKVEYEIHLARTNGLQVGAPVSLVGVPVGSVTEMRFPPDPADSFIDVTLRVSQGVEARIREDTVASIRTLGLLGDRYVELSAGTPESPAIPPGGLITSIDPVDYEALLGQSGDIVANVVEVTADLKDVLQSIDRGEGLLGAMLRNKELGESTLVNLDHTMKNLQETTREIEMVFHRVSKGEGVLGRLTRDTKQSQELLANIENAMRSIADFTKRLNQGKGTISRLVDDQAYANQVLGNLDKALHDLADAAAKLDHGDGTLGKLLNDPSLYENTQALVGRARRSWALRLFGFGGSSTPPASTPSDASGKGTP